MGWIGKLVNKHSFAATALATSLVVTGLLPAAPAEATSAEGSSQTTVSGDEDAPESSDSNDTDATDDTAINVDDSTQLDSDDGNVADDVSEAATDIEPEATNDVASSPRAGANSGVCPPDNWGSTMAPIIDLGTNFPNGRFRDNNVSVYARDDAWLYGHELEGVVFVQGNLTVDKKNTDANRGGGGEFPFHLGRGIAGGSGSWPSDRAWMLRVDKELKVYQHKRWDGVLQIGGPGSFSGENAIPGWVEDVADYLHGSEGLWYANTQSYVPDSSNAGGKGVKWQIMWQKAGFTSQSKGTPASADTEYMSSPPSNQVPFTQNGQLYERGLDELESNFKEMQSKTNTTVNCSGNTCNFIGDGVSAVQVFNVSASDAAILSAMSPNQFAHLQFSNVPGSIADDKVGMSTIIINVLGGNVTVGSGLRIYFRQMGSSYDMPVSPPVGWAGDSYGQWGTLTQHLLWRFPDASTVTIGNGKRASCEVDASFTGSIWAPKAASGSSPETGLRINMDTNGRIVSFGSLTIRAADAVGSDGSCKGYVYKGQEHHSFPLVLPNLKCDPDPEGYVGLEKKVVCDGSENNCPADIKGKEYDFEVCVGNSCESFQLRPGLSPNFGPYKENTKVCFKEKAPTGLNGWEWTNPGEQCVWTGKDGSVSWATMTNEFKSPKVPDGKLTLKKVLDGEYVDWTVGVDGDSQTAKGNSGYTWTYPFNSANDSKGVNIWENFPNGYDFEKLECTYANGTAVSGFPYTGSGAPTSSNKKPVTVKPGDAITCTFHNATHLPDPTTGFKVTKSVQANGCTVPSDQVFRIKVTITKPTGESSSETYDMVNGEVKSFSDLPYGTKVKIEEIWYPEAVNGCTFDDVTYSPETFTLGDGYGQQLNITATVTNKYAKTPDPDPGKLTLKKNLDGQDVDWNPGFGVSGGASGNGSKNPGTGGWSWDIGFTNGQSSKDVNIWENFPSGYDFEKLVCSNGMTYNGSKVPESSSSSQSVTVKPGQDVTCTFYNKTKQGKISVEKQIKFNGGTGNTSDFNNVTFDFTAKMVDWPYTEVPFQLKNGQVWTSENYPLGTCFNVTENSASSLPDGYSGPSTNVSPDPVCVGDNATTKATVTNTYTKDPETPGTKVTVIKRDQDGNSLGDWEFALQVNNGGSTNDDSKKKTPNASWWIDFNKGSTSAGVSITETSQPGYSFQNATCTDKNGKTVSVSQGTNPPKLDFTVTSGDEITCTFVNAIEQDFTVQKQVVVEGDGGSASDMSGVTYTIEATIKGQSSPAEEFKIKDGQIQTSKKYPAGTCFEITEGSAVLPDGYEWLKYSASPREFCLGTGTNVNVLVTNTYEYKPKTGMFEVEKAISGVQSGDMSAFNNQGYRVRAEVYDASGKNYLGYDEFTVYPGQSPKPSSVWPVGSKVVISETNPGTPHDDYNFVESQIKPQEFYITEGSTPSTKVTVTNVYKQKELGRAPFCVKKEIRINGDWGSKDDFRTAEFKVNASISQPRAGSDSETLTVKGNGDVVCSKNSYEIGSTVTLDEPTPGDMSGWHWDGVTWNPNPPTFQIKEGDGVAANATVTNAYTRNTGKFSVKKNIKGTGVNSNDFANDWFLVDAEIWLNGTKIGSETVEVRGDGSVAWSQNSYPTGAIVKIVAERDAFSNHGYSFEDADWSPKEFEIKENYSGTSFTITNTYSVPDPDQGSITIIKELDGREYGWWVNIVGGNNFPPNKLIDKNDKEVSGSDSKHTGDSSWSRDSKWTVEFKNGGTPGATVKVWEDITDRGFDYTFKQLDCKVGGSSLPGFPYTGSVPKDQNSAVTVPVSPNQDVVCTFSNETIQPANIYIGKLVDGVWAKDWELGVTTASGFPPAKLTATRTELADGPCTTNDCHTQQKGWDSTWAGTKWQLDFKDVNDTAGLKVWEVNQGDYLFDSLTCWNMDGNTILETKVDMSADRGDNMPTKASPSPAFTVKPGDQIECRMYNKTKPKDDEGSIKVIKKVCDFGGTANCTTTGVNWKVGVQKVVGSGDLRITSGDGQEKETNGSIGATWPTQGAANSSMNVKIWEGSSVNSSDATFKSLSCTGGGSLSNTSKPTSAGDAAILTGVKAKDNITCTFVNERPKQEPGKIILKKELCNNDGSGCANYEGWSVNLAKTGGTLEITGASSQTTTATWNTSGKTGASADVQIWETPDSSKGAFQKVTCDNGTSSTTAGGSSSSKLTLNGVKAGDTITCTFTNYKPKGKDAGSIKLKKVTTTNGADPKPAQNWELQLTSSDVNVSPTNAQKTNASGETTWSLSFDEGVKTAKFKIREVQQSPYTLKEVKCTDPNGGTFTLSSSQLTSAQNASGVEVTLPVKGTNIECTFTNDLTEKPTTPSVDSRIWMKKYFCDADGKNCGNPQAGWKVGLDLDPKPQDGVTGFAGGETTISAGGQQWNFKAPKDQEISFVLWEPEAGSKNFQSLQCGVRDFGSGSYSSYVSIGSGDTVTVGGKTYPGTKFTMKGGQELDCHLNNTEKVTEPQPAQVFLRKAIGTSVKADWCMLLDKGDSGATVTALGDTSACGDGFQKTVSGLENPYSGKKETGSAWTVTFPQGTSAATLQLSEKQQEGFVFSSGSCKIKHADNTEETADLSGSPVWTSKAIISKPIRPGDAVECLIYNKEAPTVEPKDSQIFVKKYVTDEKGNRVRKDWLVGLTQVDTFDTTVTPYTGKNPQQTGASGNGAVWNVKGAESDHPTVRLWERLPADGKAYDFVSLKCWSTAGSSSNPDLLNYKGVMPLEDNANVADSTFKVTPGMTVECDFDNKDAPAPKTAKFFIKKSAETDGKWNYEENWCVKASTSTGNGASVTPNQNGGECSNHPSYYKTKSSTEKWPDGATYKGTSWNLDLGTNQSVDVLLQEAMESGYAYHSTTCKVYRNGVVTDLEGTGSPHSGGKLLKDIRPDDQVACTIYNKEQTADKTTVSIKKETYGNIQGTGTMNPGLNWTMKLEATTPGVTVGSETKSTGTTGTATWDDIDFGAWSDMGADFQISEVMTSAQQSQWTLFGGSCSVSGKGSGGSLTNGKISVHLYPGDTVTCTLKNGKTPETSEDPAKLKIYKYLDNSPEIGWEVRALSDDATLSVTSGTKTTNDFVKTTTGGLAAWDIKFDKGKSTAKLSVSERQEEGVKFASGDCTVIRGGSKTETLDLPAGSFVSGTVRDIEFKNPIQPNDTITCNFYNETEKPVQKDDASIRITKMLNGTPAPNWWVSAVSQDSKATLTPGKWGTSQDNGWMTTSAKDDGSRGWAEWDVTFNGSNTQSVIQVTEKQQPGYEFSGGTCEVWDDNQQPEVLVNTIKIKATDFQPNVDGTVLFTLETPIKKGYSIACDFDNSTIVGPPPATVTVEKRLYENETGEGTGTLGSGWKLKLHSNTTGVTVNPEEKTTTSTGQVSWSVDFDGKDSAQFEISEVMTTAQQNDGWKLVGGTCSVTGQGSGGTVSGGKINVTLYPGDSVSCTLKNGRPGIEPAQVLLQKTIEGTPQKDWCLELSKGNSDATVTGTGTTAGCVTGFRKSESVTWNGGTEIGTKWTVEFPRDNQEAKLKVSEVQQAGFKYDGGSCVISGPTGDRFATLSGSPEYTSKAELSEPIKPGDKVVCELKNKLKPEDLDEGKIKFRKLTKQELNIGGFPTTIWGGAQDWELRLQSETPGVTVAPPGGQPGDWVTTDKNGYTTWDLTYPKGTTSFQVNLAEKKQSGWSLTSGDCKVTGGTSVNIATADLTGAQTDKGATISMKPGSELECTFRNEEVSETPGEVKIVKQVCDSVTSNNCSPTDWTVGLAWESGKLLLEDDAEPKKTGTTGAVWKTTGAKGAKAKLKIWEVNPPESNTELRSVTCKVGNDVVATWDGSTAPTSKETALVFSKEITAGDEVNCEFVNHKLVEQTPAKLWVKKTLCDEDGKNCQTAVKDWKFGVEVPESQPQGQQGVTITKGDNSQLTGVNGAVWELTGTKDKPFDLVLWEEANGNDFQKMECRTRKYGQTPEASWGNWQSIADTTTVTGSDGKQHPGAVLTFNSGDELDCVMTNNKPVVKAEGKIELFKATFDMNANGDLTNAQWGSGWELKLTSATNGVTVNPGDGFQKTGSDGKTSWTVTFPEKLETADFYLREVNQPGYNLHNLTCKSSTGGDIDVSAAVKDPGAKVTLKLDDLKNGTAISCQFDNVVPPVVAEDSAQVFLSKVNDETGAYLPDWCVRLAGTNGVLVDAVEGGELCAGGNNFQKTKAGTSYPGPDAGVKDRTGTLWEIGFPKGVTSTKLKLSENPTQAQKDAGWEFVSGSCQIKRPGEPSFPVTLTGKSAVWTDEMTLDVDIKAGDIIDCELRNKIADPKPDEAEITVDKQVCESNGSGCQNATWSVGLKQFSGFQNGKLDGKSPQNTTAEWTIKDFTNAYGDGVGVRLWEADSAEHKYVSLKCTKNGATTPFFTHKGAMPTVDEPSDLFTVMPGDKVACTFTNNKLPELQETEIVLYKKIGPSGASLAWGNDWALRVRADDPVQVLPTGSVDEDGFQSTKTGATKWKVKFPKGTGKTDFFLSEKQQEGYRLRRLYCDIYDANGTKTGTWETSTPEEASFENEAKISLTPGGKVECDFINEEDPAKPAEVTFQKQVYDCENSDQSNCLMWGKDWELKLSSNSSAVDVKPVGTADKDGFQKVPANGTTKWTVDFKGQKEAPLYLSEKGKDGYQFEKGKCTITGLDGSVREERLNLNAAPVGNPVDPTQWEVTMKPGDKVSCYFQNEVTKTAKVTMKKLLTKEPGGAGASTYKANWWLRLKETEGSGVTVTPDAKVTADRLDEDGFQKTYRWETDAAHEARWDVNFGRGVSSATVNLSEKIDREVNDGEFENTQFWKATCTINGGSAIVLGNDALFPKQVQVTIKPNDQVECKLTNSPKPLPAAISLQKYVYDNPEGTENERPGAGYQFQLAVPSGQGATVSPTGVNTTGQDGVATWQVDFAGSASAKLHLSEILTSAQQKDMALLGGACTNTHLDGTTTEVTIGKGAVSPNYAEITFAPGDAVRCYVKNAPKKLVETDISIEKVLYSGPNGTGAKQPNVGWYTKAEPNKASATAGVTVTNTTSGSLKPGSDGGWIATNNQNTTTWKVNFGGNDKATIIVSEKAQDGYELTGWSCSIVHDGTATFNQGKLTEGKDQIDIELEVNAGIVDKANRINCTFENSPRQPLTLQKQTTSIPGGSENADDWKLEQTWMVGAEIRDEQAKKNGASVEFTKKCDNGTYTGAPLDGFYPTLGDKNPCARWWVEFGQNTELTLWVSEQGKDPYVFYGASCTIVGQDGKSRTEIAERTPGEAELDKAFPITVYPGDRSISCMFQNAMPGGGVEWEKVSETETKPDSDEPLGLTGSRWQIWSLDANGERDKLVADQIEGLQSCNEQGEDCVITNRFMVGNLTPGKYHLIEVVAPEGHSLLVTPIEFEVASGQISQLDLGAIENSKASIGPNLPMAGGLGTLIFIVVAGGSSAVAIALGVFARKRRGRHSL